MPGWSLDLVGLPTVTLAMTVAFVSGLAMGAPAPGSGASLAPVERGVPVAGKRVDRFLVEDVNARSSAARRVNVDLADKRGRVPEATGGYRLTNRVIVETGDLGALRAAPSVPGAASVSEIAGAPGFAAVEVGSVGEAIELAERLRASGLHRSVELDVEAPRALRAPAEANLASGTIWHLRNTVTPIADINADAAWDLGYTGAGVVLGIVEGGFQQSHPDLTGNFNATASQSAGQTSHATSCAGIAAAGGNGFGAVGLAYNAQISEQAFGSSSTNATAFGFRNDLIDAKSNSWGPADNGTISFMSGAERAAIEDALANGRGGLGTIFCWAAGNGGVNDRVDYDAYASNRHVFSIGAIGEFDTEASYNELGSSMLVVAHSDGDFSGGQRGTYTTTTTSAYTSSFGGTSSASPLGMGAIALALEANPALTWRDLKHVLVNAARKCDPGDTSWTTNAAGHDISYKFGFGAIDAGALVSAAMAWDNVGEEVSASSGVQAVGLAIPDNNSTGLTQTAEITENITIESVELVMNVTHTFVGDLFIAVTSPQGTESQVAVLRSNDSQDNYNDYIFTSHRPFGESSQGTWTVTVKDLAINDVGTWNSFEVRVHGASGITPCNPADCDASGELNLDDVDCFVTAFLASDLDADCTGDGVLNLDDIDCFLTAFSAGCE